MPTSSNGWQQAYNGQAAVDMNTHLIVGGHLSQTPNDKQQLEPSLDQLQQLPEQLGEPTRITADNGYYSEHNVNEAASRELTPYLATGRRKHNPRSDPGPPPDDPSPLEAMAWRLRTPEGNRGLRAAKSDRGNGLRHY